MNWNQTLKRYRWWALLPLPMLVILAHSFGPDGWRDPLVRLLWLSWASIALAATHLARKAMHDYADAQEAWERAMEGNVAAGLAFLGICALSSALFLGLLGFARAI
ncbi:MAG: hypothetical protein HEQ39_09765 [Rhizobacter sp.]|jgi:hypothetical protein